jgi:hypothetical protein
VTRRTAVDDRARRAVVGDARRALPRGRTDGFESDVNPPVDF